MEVVDSYKIIEQNIISACKKSGRNINDITLVAVSKTIAPENVNKAVGLGVKIIGENRAQELVSKYDFYDKSAKVHFIGHLQTNKVKQIIDKVSMIQSLDSVSLAEEIQKQCEKHNKSIDVLIEINIGEEETKSGVLPSAVISFAKLARRYNRLVIKGIMVIPPASESEEEKIRHFEMAKEIFENLKQNYNSVNTLSMGMSDDYMLAIEHGSTMIRLGRALFGERIYNTKEKQNG